MRVLERVRQVVMWSWIRVRVPVPEHKPEWDPAFMDTDHMHGRRDTRSIGAISNDRVDRGEERRNWNMPKGSTPSNGSCA